MKYRKKPVVIEAFKYDGDLMNSDGNYYVPDWARKSLEEGDIYYASLTNTSPPCILYIRTLEGPMRANVGDYIIQGIRGEIYPCKPHIFEATYEKVEEINNQPKE